MAILSDSIVNGNLSVTDNIYVGGLRVATESDLNAAKQKLKDMVDGSITTITAGDLAGITRIRAYAFNSVSSLINIGFPNTLQEIGQRAFAGCTGIQSLNLPDSVLYLNSYCFSSCTSLVTVVIGSGISYIWGRAFNGCYSLTSITINATIPPTLDSSDAFINTNDCPIYVPYSADHSVLAAYQSATNWSNIASRIREIS